MKRALVLSGGGANGAFQIGALKALDMRGFTYDVVAGVSVGALNGVMVATGQFGKLETLWDHITARDIYKKPFLPLQILRLLLGRRLAIYDNRPLRKLLETYMEGAHIGGVFLAGATDLVTGEYVRYGWGPCAAGTTYVNGSASVDAVWSSATMPVFWEPVRVGGRQYMVDGGVRNISPLGDVLAYDPDEIVVINCAPADATPAPAPKNILQVLQRTIEIMEGEIFRADLDEFLRINQLVSEAAKSGVTLHSQSGRELKAFKTVLIEPDLPVGGTLDFSRKSLDRRHALGMAAALKALAGRGGAGAQPAT